MCRCHAEETQALILAHTGLLLDAPPATAVPAFVDAMAGAHAIAPELHLTLVRERLNDGGDLLTELQDPGHALVVASLERHRALIRPRDIPAATRLLTNTVEAAIHGQLFRDPSLLAEPEWRTELVDLLLRYLMP